MTSFSINESSALFTDDDDDDDEFKPIKSSKNISKKKTNNFMTRHSQRVLQRRTKSPKPCKLEPTSGTHHGLMKRFMNNHISNSKPDSNYSRLETKSYDRSTNVTQAKSAEMIASRIERCLTDGEPTNDLNSFQDSIQIADFSQIDQAGLIRAMHERFIVKAAMWEAFASMYSKLSFFMHFTVLLIQVFHILSQQLAEMYRLPPNQIQTIQYVLAASTAIIAGLQMKLKMYEKCEKYRRGAKVYARLKRATTYCLLLIDHGGKIEDVSVLWKQAMSKEASAIPMADTFMSA